MGPHRLPMFGREMGRRIGADIGTNSTDIGNRCCLSACDTILPRSANTCYRCSADRSSATSVPTSASVRKTSVTDVGKTPWVPRVGRHIGTDIGIGPIDIGYRCQ